MADERNEIFHQLRLLLAECVPPLRAKADSPTLYDVCGTKTVTVAKKTVEGMYFASVAERKGATVLYFFPIYTHPKAFGGISADLKKCLEGKSCFHFQTLDPKLLAAVRDMVKAGLAIYRKDEWV